MSEPDPYVLLGVGQGASQDEIHDAYRKLAKRYHPDLHPGDPAAERSFKEIAAAYDLLSDPLERARLDREHAESGGADTAGAYRARSPGAASDARRSGGSTSGGSEATSPRRPAPDPSGFYREPMVENTWTDPETGLEYALPKGAKGRLIGVVLVVLAVGWFSVVALDGANFWGRGRTHTTIALIDPRTIMYCVVGFVLLCGVVVGGVMNWVERRARANESERPQSGA